MSLMVYSKREDVPKNIKIIDSNDLYFNNMSIIPDTPISHEILRKIDKAEYNSDLTFIGRTKEIGALYKQYLSSGAKTLLNIIQHKDKCFNLIECGNNVLQFIPKLNDGFVLWELIVAIPEEEDEKCDIIYNDKHYDNFTELLEYVRHGEDEY